MAIGLATFFPSSDGAVPWGASAMATVGLQVLVERQQHRLGARDRTEHREHQVTQAVAVTIQRRDDHAAVPVFGHESGVGRVDEHRMVAHVGVASGGARPSPL